MSRRARRWLLLIAAILSLAFVVFSFVAAGIVAEGALHPLLRRRATDAATLAISISEATGASVEKVSIRAADGTRLNAWWLVPKQRSGRGVMVCHGVADSAHGALGFAVMFLRDGYAVLVPESRGHGESRGFVTYGVLEADDTVQWLAWMRVQGVRRAYGFGESLGGAILIQSLARGAQFRAVVAECSYSSFEMVADERVAWVLPKWAAPLFVKEAELYTYFRYGVDLRNARPDRAIRDARVPVLLIHGLDDRETIPDHSRRLHAANPRWTELWLVPGAKHTGAFAVAPALFQSRVLAWFARYS